MKKWLWAIPVCLILLTSVAVGILNTRDIDPDSEIYSADPRELAPLSEAEVLNLLEEDGSYSALDFALISESDTQRLYITKSEPQKPEPEALNSRVYTRDLGNGWTYVFEYVCEITFSAEYLKQLERELEAEVTAVFYLRDKTLCAAPGDRSKSAYTVEAHVKTASGEEMLAFFDPKTKVFIGFEN